MNRGMDQSVATQISMENDCTGCAACANVCPVGAIRMVPYGSEGFYKPHVNSEVCVNCGLCSRTCPQHEFKDRNGVEPACYAVMASDEVRMKSSSGGVFTVLAEEILKRGGVVCGAAFDENWRVHHIIVEDAEGLNLLRGSKYVQSFISEELFKEIKQYLNEGRAVLFTGVPCQVAGLHAFLRKEYDNLFTVDLICAYAPSPKVFEQYLHENYVLSDIRAINFRDKKQKGWCAEYETVITSAGEKISRMYTTPYLNRMFKGEHCVNCKYKCLPRPGDMTMGDFWRINKFASGMDDRKGTSGMLLHNDKARQMFKMVKGNFIKARLMDARALTWQINVLPRKIRRTPACLKFFHYIDERSYNHNTVEAPREARVVGIANWWFVNNRGAVLTNFALNKLVEELGYEALTINYIPPFERTDFNHKGYARNFAEKYIKRTRYVDNYEQLKGLNNDISTFIAGSDQIFNFRLCRGHGFMYYMGWVDAKINKLISCAASFAYNRFFVSNSFQKSLVEYWLTRFDAHSIREREGIKIMRDVFGIDSEFVLDPVFCVDKSYYTRMAEKSNIRADDDFIVYYYTKPEACNHPGLIEHVMRKTGAKRAIDLYDWDVSMEDWLWYMMHAKFIITNSFHGSCIALIFNKPYACFMLEPEIDTRFATLIELSGHGDRIFKSWSDILHADHLFELPNFERFNTQLPDYVARSRRFLEDALTKPKEKQFDEIHDIADAIINRLDEEQFDLNMHCLEMEERVRDIEEKLGITRGAIRRNYYRVKKL